MKLSVNRFFLSKRSAKKTVALGYGFGMVSLAIGLMDYDSYRKYGYFTYWGTHISGNDALITAVGVIAVSFIILLFAVYTTIMYLFFAKRSDFAKLPPARILMCGKCQDAVSANEVSDLICLKCGGHLEDVRGFYNRHAELKNVANDRIKAIEQ